MCPHHHPDSQAAVQTDDHQEENAGEHANHGHKVVELAHETPKRPLVLTRGIDGGENQEERKNKVSQCQVQKPNGVDRFFHSVSGHVDD